jgi:hypothetical protein
LFLQNIGEDMTANINEISATGLYRGAVLATIAHALSVAHFPLLVYEHGWDKFTYLTQNSMGTRCAITFDASRITLVGTFFDAHSPRSPFSSVEDYDYKPYFVGIPSKLSRLKDHNLHYMLDDLAGNVVPLITGAIWSTEIGTRSIESWREVCSHGGEIIRVQLLEPAESMSIWEEAYDLNKQQITIMRSLYYKKVNNPGVRITLALDAWEYASIFEERIDLTNTILNMIDIEITK